MADNDKKYLFQCPDCGCTQFSPLEYQLVEYDFGHVTMDAKGEVVVDDDTWGAKREWEDTLPFDTPYRCRSCHHEFTRKELTLVPLAAHRGVRRPITG